MQGGLWNVAATPPDGHPPAPLGVGRRGGKHSTGEGTSRGTGTSESLRHRSYSHKHRAKNWVSTSRGTLLGFPHNFTHGSLTTGAVNKGEQVLCKLPDTDTGHGGLTVQCSGARVEPGEGAWPQGGGGLPGARPSRRAGSSAQNTGGTTAGLTRDPPRHGQIRTSPHTCY